MKKTTIVMMLLIYCAINFASAQQTPVLENISLRNGYPSFANFSQSKSKQLSTDKGKMLLQILGNPKQVTFKRNVEPLSLKGKRDLVQEKFQLLKDNIKLRGGEYTIISVDDSTSFISGFFADFTNEKFDDRFSGESSKQIAITQFNAQRRLSGRSEKIYGIAGSINKLYYFDYVKEKYRPAYQVEVTSSNGEFSTNVFVNAADGSVMGTEDLICTINQPGTAQTTYSGVRNIVTDAASSSGPFTLQQTRNSVLIRTRNMNHRLDLANVTNFSDNDNNWTATEHSADQGALDIHWAMEKIYDYWFNVHGRNSIDGSGMGIDSYVHMGTGVFNARWANNTLQFGDGIFSMAPLTSIDIASHEFGHGIDQFTGNLLYEKESGALDEGFADIWGACVEAWADPNKNRWLLGEEVLGGPLRSMSNPKAYNQPDTYGGINWVSQSGCTPDASNDACGVHTNSGVLNYWFFLLSQGGSGTNDLNHAYQVTGLGIDKAAAIAYATKLLVGGSSNYATCRSLSLMATILLYGPNSCEVKSVTEAWYAVGVGAKYTAALGMSISGPSYICDGGTATYTLLGVPPGATVTWTENMEVISSSNTQITVRHSNDNNEPGTIHLQATVNTNCGSIMVQSNPIVVDLPAYINDVEVYCEDGCAPYNHFCGNPSEHTYFANFLTYYLSVAPAVPVTLNYRINQSIQGQVTVSTATGSIMMPNNLPVGTNQVELWLSGGPCNSTGWIYDIGIEVSDCGYASKMVAYPNPTNTELKIGYAQNELRKSSEGFKSTVADFSVKLLDKNGRVLREGRTSANKKDIVLNVASIPNGIYYLHIFEGTKVNKQQIVIFH